MLRADRHRVQPLPSRHATAQPGSARHVAEPLWRVDASDMLVCNMSRGESRLTGYISYYCIPILRKTRRISKHRQPEERMSVMYLFFFAADDYVLGGVGVPAGPASLPGRASPLGGPVSPAQMENWAGVAGRGWAT